MMSFNLLSTGAGCRVTSSSSSYCHRYLRLRLIYLSICVGTLSFVARKLTHLATTTDVTLMNNLQFEVFVKPWFGVLLNVGWEACFYELLRTT